MINLLKEGGNATAALLPSLEKHQDNAARKLYVGKITDADLDLLLPEKYGVFPSKGDHSYIGKLLSVLGSKGLIDSSYAPTFLMGSTRLAALKHFGKDVIWTDELETDDIIQIASGKKVEFGDLDADVIYRGDKKAIVAAINAIDPSTFAARMVVEIHVAIRIGDKVVQIDLVDIADDDQSYRFTKKSSFLDLASGIKGALGTRLLRATAINMDIDPSEALDALYDVANKNPTAPFSIALQKKIKIGYVPTRVRFSLGGEGLKLVLDLKKQKDGKTIQDKIEVDINPRADYKNLDVLAKQLLQDPAAQVSDIYHTVSLASFIAKHKQDKVQSIWKDFLELCEKTVKGHIDDKDYETGIKEIGKILGIKEGTQLTEGREAIGRFEGKNQFTNSEVLELLETIVKETGTQGQPQIQINLKENPTVDMIEKMDSNFCHFGLDRNGKFFMESSNSGPVYENTVDKKWGIIDLTEPFKYLNGNTKFQSSLKKIFRSIGPFKYDAESFPVLTHKGNENNEIVFVATKYRREKFGTAGAFVVFKAWLWNDSAMSWYRPEPAKNIQVVELLKHEAVASGWNKEWKIYTNETDMKLGGNLTINLGKVLAYYLSADHLYQKALALLKMRSKNSEKDELVSELNKIRNDLQGALDTFANQTHSVLGDKDSSIEGVVLRVKASNGDIYEVKGTSEEFNNQKDFIWHDRTAIINLENIMENRFLKDVLNLKTTQPAALNKAIASAADEFIASSSGQNKKAEFIRFLVPYLLEGEPDFDLTKSNAITILSEIEKYYNDLLTSFKQNEPNLDQDSVRKTNQYFEAFKEKFKSYKQITHSPLNGPEFYVHVFNTVLGFRIDKFLNFSEELTTKEEQKREKVIIWNGRAQPWHKGHDAMIQRGKEHLKKLGATKILIMIVKGSQSSQNLEENPLNEKEQTELIYSIYRNDPQVEIYNKFPKSSYIMDIMEHISSTGYVIAGWLAGADRFTDYRKALKSFNPANWKETHDYSPVLFNQSGSPIVEMIETPRVMSGTKAREMTKTVDFQTWLQEVAPQQTDKMAARVYLAIYNKIRGEI